jgi:ABC-type dipeptide/oligopeptide/nickel transport system permease subunit
VTITGVPLEQIEVVDQESTPTQEGTAREVLRALLRDRTAMFGVILVTLLCLAAIFAGVLAPKDPNLQDVASRFDAPSRDHLLGTDHLGRDVLSRVLLGARLSIGSALVAGLSVALVGLLMGMLAGYFGGIVDTIISRVVDVLLAFPLLLLALTVTGILGPGLRNIIISLVVASWASYARIVRSAVLAEKNKAYVEAARAAGASHMRILFRHVLPNIVAPVIVFTTLDTGVMLLAVSSLSFLGLGVKPPAAEWGAMLSEGRAYLDQAPQMMFYPGAAIFLTVLGLNLLGDGLRDALDPRTRAVVADDAAVAKRLLGRRRPRPSPS